MFPEFAFIQVLYTVARQRVTALRLEERGEVAEKVIITAIFAGLAIAVGAIIVAKVTDKAKSIPTQ